MRIWPFWAQSVGAMIEHGAIVRVGCAKCRTFFDVDLLAVEAVRGGHYSLIDSSTQCKITSCRGRGYFIAAQSMTHPLILLVNASFVAFRLDGLRPIDIEPPPPPPTAPARGPLAVLERGPGASIRITRSAGA